MIKKTNRRTFGDAGEDIAAGLLKENGYKLLDTNFYTKYGEIDIIALDGNILVFVEVKTRFGKKYGLPEEAVTAKKIKNIKRASNIYCKKHKNLPEKKRIDIVSIIMKHKKVDSYKIIEMT